MIEQNVRDFLRDDSDITNRVEHRIYPLHRPQGQLGEMLILQEMSDDPEYVLSGESGVHDGSIQITSWADTQKAAKSLSELVRNRCSGYQGSLGDQGETTVYSFRLLPGSRPTVDPPKDGSDTWAYGYVQVYGYFATGWIPTLS